MKTQGTGHCLGCGEEIRVGPEGVCPRCGINVLPRTMTPGSTTQPTTSALGEAVAMFVLPMRLRDPLRLETGRLR